MDRGSEIRPSGSLSDRKVPTHLRIPGRRGPVTKAFTILRSSAAAAASTDDNEYRNSGTFIANKLRNYLPRTRNKAQHIITAADRCF